MNNYMKNRWIRRRAEAVEFLGGKCIKCGTSESLEFDHIDPSTKTMTIARASSRSAEFFMNEVKKCQLLCTNCHLDKTLSEKEVAHGGGLAGKKNCPCSLCKAKKAEYMAEYMRAYRSRR